MRVFGPVPSRRLGRSLGINNIPPKICTYSCVYCQLGNTIDMRYQRESFFDPKELYKEAKKKIEDAKKNNEHIDYITFVPDGEPTLDINLRKEIELLKSLKIKIALITNSSLLFDEGVQDALSILDWISVKIDGITEKVWKRIDRPHKALNLLDILRGIEKLKRNFKGVFTTETMLVKGVNDHKEELEKIAQFLNKLKPHKAYISIPTRPPAEPWVESPSEDAINNAYQIFTSYKIDTEYLIGYEGSEFAYTGNPEEDLLSITSVHPMREEGVKNFLEKSGKDWSFIQKLIQKGVLVEVEFEGKRFYMRKLGKGR